MFHLSDKMYDILKWVVGVVLPALGALYSALASLWGWPYGEEAVATVMTVVMLLGAFLQMNVGVYAVKNANNNSIPSEMLPKYPFKMSGPVYDTVKWVATVALPSMSIAYLALAKIWLWPYGDYVSATIAAVVVCMSTILQFSSSRRQKAQNSVHDAMRVTVS